MKATVLESAPNEASAFQIRHDALEWFQPAFENRG